MPGSGAPQRLQATCSYEPDGKFPSRYSRRTVPLGHGPMLCQTLQMGHNLNMITLGVRDKTRSRAFYEALGWEGSGGEGEDPAFFCSRGTVVALWDRASLAADSHVTDSGGWGGVTLAYCVASRQEVDDIVQSVRAAGGTITREPAATFWGGYDAMMADPDGHPWEIAHNPYWTITDDGAIQLS